MLFVPDGSTCRLCGRTKRAPLPRRVEQSTSGLLVPKEAETPERWFSWRPTCNHEVFYTCSDCGHEDERIACAACGSGCFYT